MHFNLEKIIHNVTMNPRCSIFNRTRHCMAYANDDVITGRSTPVINKVIQDMEETTNDTGL